MDASDAESEFVALLTEHQLALRVYVQSLLPGDDAARDVAQQANAKIWEKRADFTHGTNFKAWTFAIARYEVLNYRKRQARDARLVFSNETVALMADEWSAMDDTHLDRRQGALRCCLDKLKPADRELIHHRYFKGTSLKEYAETIGRSAGGLKVTLHRIRNQLLGCIERTLTQSEI